MNYAGEIQELIVLLTTSTLRRRERLVERVEEYVDVGEHNRWNSFCFLQCCCYYCIAIESHGEKRQGKTREGKARREAKKKKKKRKKKKD